MFAQGKSLAYPSRFKSGKSHPYLSAKPWVFLTMYRPVEPYDAILDKSGHVWTGGEPTDFVTRLDPKTGEMVNYLLPTVNANIRRVYADNFSDPPSMLVGENHRAKIVLVQPLE